MCKITYIISIIILFLWNSGCTKRKTSIFLDCERLDSIESYIKVKFLADSINFSKLELKEEIYFPTLNSIQVKIFSPTFIVMNFKDFQGGRIENYQDIEIAIQNELKECYDKIIQSCSTEKIEKVNFIIMKKISDQIPIISIQFDIDK